MITYDCLELNNLQIFENFEKEKQESNFSQNLTKKVNDFEFKNTNDSDLVIDHPYFSTKDELSNFENFARNLKSDDNLIFTELSKSWYFQCILGGDFDDFRNSSEVNS